MIVRRRISSRGDIRGIVIVISTRIVDDDATSCRLMTLALLLVVALRLVFAACLLRVLNQECLLLAARDVAPHACGSSDGDADNQADDDTGRQPRVV